MDADTKVFINLVVNDLEMAKKFYEGLGFTINPQFTDETAACVVISDIIYVMALTEDKMKQFTKKDIVDSHSATEAIVTFSVKSRDEVDQFADNALAAGAGVAREPEDHGFMYSRSFEDPDGHIWEVFWMDVSQVPAA